MDYHFFARLIIISMGIMSERLILLDVWRGCIILAMIFYHLMWNLGYFNFVDFRINRLEGWLIFKNIIITNFVFIAGISTHILANSPFFYKKVFYRVGLLFLAAALVTVFGYIGRPSSPIYMGILHFFALATLLVIPVARHRLSCILLAMTIFTVSYIREYPNFNGTDFCFTSLEESCHKTSDFVPLFPWLGVLLMGVVLAPLFLNCFKRFAPKQKIAGIPLVSWLGRHSLSIYLIHAPLLFVAIGQLNKLIEVL
jgi:uncharacterized membrane protein